MACAPTFSVKGGLAVRVDGIRANWSETERARRAARALRQTQRLAALLGLDVEEPEILAVGAPCCEDLLRMES